MKLEIVYTGLAMEACYLAFTFFGPGPREVIVLIATHAVAFALLALFIWRRKQSDTWGQWRTTDVVAVVLFGVVFRLTLVPHAVVGSDDVYRYLWDGKVFSAGINPYAYGPRDAHLAPLATTELPALVNHPELRTVYPPLAQAFFYVVYSVAGSSVSGFKFAVVLVDCLSILLLLGMLRAGGRSPGLVTLYAWSPLPILYFGLDGHIDALGILFLLFFLLLMVRKRPLSGALALGASALAKLSPLILAPLFLRSSRGVKRISAPLLTCVVVGGGYLLFLEPTWGVTESLRTMGQIWEFNGGIFAVVYYFCNSNETAHLICAGMILVFIAVLTFLDRPLMEKVFWAFAGFFLLSPVVHPWYLTWLAALLVLRWSTAIFAFLGLSVLANVVVYQFRAGEGWTDQPLLLAIEYLPVYILLVREMMKGEVLSSRAVESIPFAKRIAAPVKDYEDFT